MVVLDGRLKSEALACLLFSNFLLVSVRANHHQNTSKPWTARTRTKKALGELIHHDALKTNQQITVRLPGKDIRVFQYLDVENNDHNLSITVIPCGSKIRWSFQHRNFDEAFNENDSMVSGNAESYEIAAMETVTVKKAKKGVYLLVFYPIGIDTRASVYVTMDDGGPYELTIPQNPNLVLIPQRQRRLKVTWEQSSINPQNTSYCLVVNTKKEYSSLCDAEENGSILRGLEGPAVINLNNLKLENKKLERFIKSHRVTKPANNDTVIVCVERKRQLTFTKLKKGVKYYFNLFAINNKTNLTIPYGNSFIKYNFTVKPITLQDGVRKLVNLRKMEGKALFRYKVGSETKKIHFYVLVCGGAVDVEVKSKRFPTRQRQRKDKDYYRERLPKPTRVSGYKRFKILRPANGEQLYLKLNAPNVDELTRIKYVEVFITMHPEKKYPLPIIPDDSTLYEFKSQKTCNSVTIGWRPVHDNSVNTYCVVVWENQNFDYYDFYKGYFQCDLDDKLWKKSYLSLPKDVTVSKECEDMVTKNAKSITNYKIRDLNPGTSYTIQVTVKKKNGRTLSYKYLKAYTKHSCEY